MSFSDAAARLIKFYVIIADLNKHKLIKKARFHIVERFLSPPIKELVNNINRFTGGRTIPYRLNSLCMYIITSIPLLLCRCNGVSCFWFAL